MLSLMNNVETWFYLGKSFCKAILDVIIGPYSDRILENGMGRGSFNESEICELIDASLEHCASIIDLWSPLLIPLLKRILSKALTTPSSLVVDLLAYRVCNFPHARFVDKQLCSTLCGLSSRTAIKIALARQSTCSSSLSLANEPASCRLSNAGTNLDHLSY